MKKLWNNFKVAFAMFSKIPMPMADWNKENMKYMFCFFPMIGIVIGALSILAAWIGTRFSFHPLFVTVIMILISIFVTGGIHVDGLLDTSDAMSSWQERSRRLEILKDSNAGAFAVITAGVYFLLWIGSYIQMYKNLKAVCVMALVFILSRSLSGIGVVSIPKARTDGTVAEFSRNSAEKRVRIILIGYVIVLYCGMIYIQPVYGVCASVCSILVYFYYKHMAMKYFGGTTGDLAGFFLCLCELGCACVISIANVFC
ncbi:MAG: adenosylcobinamide-GDP ribazoletransferase [Eubacteriales bacterium]|nr:adenosylcobinamide-GDP ribazoletransferase [Eubacteriales bacterium]